MKRYLDLTLMTATLALAAACGGTASDIGTDSSLLGEEVTGDHPATARDRSR